MNCHGLPIPDLNNYRCVYGWNDSQILQWKVHETQALDKNFHHKKAIHFQCLPFLFPVAFHKMTSKATHELLSVTATSAKCQQKVRAASLFRTTSTVALNACRLLRWSVVFVRRSGLCEVLYLRGTLPRAAPWDVMVDSPLGGTAFSRCR